MSLRIEARLPKKNLLLVAAICSFFPTALPATQTNYASAGVGGRWMNLPGSARSQAVAQASSSLADDINSILINPAGLGRLKNPQVMLSQNYWIEGSSMQYAAFGMPVFKSAGMALGVRYANFGIIDRISVSPSGFLKQEGTIRPYGMAVDLSWGQAFGKSLHLGLATNIAFQKLDTSRAAGILATLGGLWKVPETPITIGAVLENVGSDLGGASPVNIRLGGKYSVDLESLGLRGKLNLLPEANFVVRDRENPVVSLGAEYWAVNILALRAGYQLGNKVAPKGLAVGLGLRYQWIGLDYAFNTAANGFSNTHLITLVAGLGGSKEASNKPLAATKPLNDNHNAPRRTASDIVLGTTSSAQKTPPAPTSMGTKDRADAAKAMTTAVQKDLKRFNPVREDENTVMVKLPPHPKTIYFGPKKSVLSQIAQKQIQEISTVLEQYPKSKIWVGAYSDSVGPKESNLLLSVLRARTVSFALQKNGISKNRISKLVGFGESMPVADNSTEEGRAANRRVELRIKFDVKDF